MPKSGDAAEENSGTPKLGEKTKQLESRSNLDKQVTQMKFKRNQKQFELNAQMIDSAFDRICLAKNSKNKQVDDLANEGKKLIRKRQKLIRIADESADSWKVVDEYVLDELASRSEDEKCLKKAKEAASRKRRQPAQGGSRLDKKFKGTSTLTDQQLFLFAFLFSLSQILPDHFWGTLFAVSLVGVLMRSTHV